MFRFLFSLAGFVAGACLGVVVRPLRGRGGTGATILGAILGGILRALFIGSWLLGALPRGGRCVSP